MLTTSAVVNDVVPYARALPGFVPAVIEIDALDLDAPPSFRPTSPARSETALLQYTSGSTRDPAAVVVTHKNIFANVQQVVSDYFEDSGKVPPPDSRWCRGCRSITTWGCYSESPLRSSLKFTRC